MLFFLHEVAEFRICQKGKPGNKKENAVSGARKVRTWRYRSRTSGGVGIVESQADSQKHTGT